MKKINNLILVSVVASSVMMFSCVSKSSGKTTNEEVVDTPLVKSSVPSPIETFEVNGVKFDMIAVEGGTFTMGATKEQMDEAKEFEFPAHKVTLDSYCIGKTEVTQSLWKAVMGVENNPSAMKGDNLPVENISWIDCQEFINKLNALTGHTFRLPTEAEWEFAARGGNKSLGYKYSGSNDILDVAWIMETSEGTQPVATLRPNELGIYDMSGNVYEWCSDWFDYYNDGLQTNPKGPASSGYRVTRGGSWSGFAGGCRVSFRFFTEPDFAIFNLGLRLASDK